MQMGGVIQKLDVSPEFRLRPSLSEARPQGVARPARRVAGVQTPAFVERSLLMMPASSVSVCRRSSDSGLR